jgi:integrase
MEDGIELLDQWALKGHQRGKRWQFRVWDPRRRSWKSKSYVDGKKSDGRQWAEDQRALLRWELTSTGALPFATVAAEYVAAQKARGLNERYIAEVERVAAAVVEAGAVDMKAAGFEKTVRDWLASAPCFFKPKPAGPVRPTSHRPSLDNLRMRLARAEQLATTCTVKERSRYARRLDHWRARVARAETVTTKHGRVPSTITKNRWLVILQSIGKLAVAKFGLHRNPLTGIRRFKFEKTVKNALRIDELRRMVADERCDDDYFRMAILLVYTGMRAREAAHARWDWIDRAARTITIRVRRNSTGQLRWAPKGNKERVVPLLSELADLLDQVPEHRRVGWVIPDGRVRSYDDRNQWEAFRRYLGVCGIDAEARDLSPHCTRHTWTAIMLATGASPNRVRRWLGHEKLSTTDIYADAESTFEHVVKEWPRGEMRLRPAKQKTIADLVVTIDPAQPALSFLHEYLAGGGTFEQLAAASRVPIEALKAWVVEGVPVAVMQYVAARLATLAASQLSPPMVAAYSSRLPG